MSLPAMWKLQEKSGNLKMKTSKHKELSDVLVGFLGGFLVGCFFSVDWLVFLFGYFL